MILVHYFTYTLRPEVACNAHHHHHGPVCKETLLDRASEQAIKGLAVVVEPVMKYKPLDLLSDGRLVSWRLTGEALGLLWLLYPSLLCVVGSWALRRRELGLPKG